MTNLFFQLGPAPVPPPSPSWYELAIPFLVVGLTFAAMLLSVTLRYSDRVREWWEANVCGWMEEHVVKSDETKGGR